MVSAASFRLSKMPAMVSGIVPMTKQLNSVTLRSVPAPAVTRPAGRNRKSSSAARNFGAQSAGVSSTAASARAMRSQLSSTVASRGVPSASFRRYFISQICSAMGAAKRVMVPPDGNLGQRVAESASRT